MKIFTANSKRFSGRSAPFFAAALLAAAAMLPASGFALAPVDLLSTANYAVLSGAGITNVPTSAITGDVGASPIAGSAITGFGLTEITGTIYTVDATYPTANTAVVDPVRLTQAKNDLTVAYNEAAARTPVPTGAFLNPGDGNMGGLTLGPGLYKFTATALISGSDLTLQGNANDVWIFQIGTTLTVENDIHVVLAGGAQAGNVFWQVGSAAALGVNSVMQGTIMADQAISLGTHATLNGRALTRIAGITFQMNTITRPSLDLTPNATPVGAATWGELKETK